MKALANFRSKGKKEESLDDSNSDNLEESNVAPPGPVLDYNAIRTIESIEINSCRLTEIGKDVVTVYQVVIKTRGFSYFVSKRFSEFDELYQLMKIRHKKIFKFDNFPSKLNILKSMEAVNRERKQKLQDFLNYLQKLAFENIDKTEVNEYFDFIEMATCNNENILRISTKYSFSPQSGQIECNDIQGILQLLQENDRCSLKLLGRLEKIIFQNAKKLKREEIRIFMLGEDNSSFCGFLNIYDNHKDLPEMVARAYMNLVQRIITPCSIVNNEYARKFFGKCKSNYFKTGLLGKYLNLNLKEKSHQSECKRLAFEILTVYKCENPLFDETQVFKDPDDHRRYLRWLMMNHPSVYPHEAPQNMYCMMK